MQILIKRNFINNLLSWILSLAILFFVLFNFAGAQETGGIVNCDGPDCNWQKLVELINKMLKFVVFDISLPLCAVLFMYSGWQMMTSQGDMRKFTMARKIFTNVVIGFAIVMVAYYVVKFGLGVLGFEDKTGLF